MTDMAPMTASVEEQMRILMSGVEYGDPHIEATMERELRQRLGEGRPLRVYCGFDPTVSDLHLGYIVPMLKLRQFQRFGHDVTFLMGTMTATVGDPSDRTAARQMRTLQEVEALVETWVHQASRLLDPQRTAFKRNATWLAPLGFEDIARLASHFTVQQFLERQGFRERLETGKPIYLHEFLYPLMQGYDAVALETDVQVGGVDQLFNIMAGRELQRDFGQEPLVAVCVPLLIGTDGHLKMSQSTGNYISLDAPPADMYGKLMSIPDSLIVNYFTLLTDVPPDDVAAIERGIADRSLNPMEAKKRLARDIVALLYDEAAAAAAQADFHVTHQTRTPIGTPDESAFDWVDLPAGIVEVRVSGQWIPTARPPGERECRDVALPKLLSDNHLASSISEARRLIRQGAVEVIGSAFQRPPGMFSRQHPRVVRSNTVTLDDGMVIRIGKAKFIRIVPA